MAQLRLAVVVKRRGRPSIPAIPIQSLHMGPKYNVQTCSTKFSGIQKYWGHVCHSKGRKSGNLTQMAELRLVMVVKRRRRPSIPSIPIQSLHMGTKYNVQTCCTKFSGIQKYWGHVCLSKGQKSGNLTQMAQFQLAMVVKRRRRPSIPSMPIQLTICPVFSPLRVYLVIFRLFASIT
jgi:hypothetical protein